MVLVSAGCATTATDDPSAVATTGGGSGSSAKGSADDSETKVASATRPVKKGTLPFKGKDGTVRDRKVTIRAGRAYLGDMGFGPVDDMTPRSVSVSDLDLRWPNATVPYCFYNGSDSAIRLPQHTRDAFRTAAQTIQSHVPSIRFVERASCSEAVNDYASEDYLPPTPGDAVLVVMRQSDSGGHAEIGYANTARSMTLADDIGSFDPETQGPKAVHVVSHELGHTLGLKHEHQRPDRGEWVNVCEGNIPDDDEGDYAILDPSDIEMLAPYEYHSKMHYPAKEYDFPHVPMGCEGKAMQARHETVPEVPGTHTVMGSRWFTTHDMNSLMLMYGPGLGAAEIDDKFGTAIAVGDFDLDGRDDVIVGGPGEKIGSGERSGTAYAYKGTWRSPAPWKLLRESAIAAEEDDDRFGTAFAVGDFVRQASCVPTTPGSCELPFPDLAVGVPGKRGDTKAQLGAVMMYMGGRFYGAVYRPDCDADPECRGTNKEPLAPLPVVLRAADARGVVGNGGDLFGQSLAAGDFDGDGEMDLAVGAPGVGNIGRVFIYRGADMKKGVYVSRELNPFGAANVAGAKFGWSLAAGDFDLDGKDDLAIGAPGAGAGQVVYFRGLTPTTNQVAVPILAAAGSLLMPSPTANTPTGSAQFGFSLAASHLLNTNRASLVVGAPAQRGVSTLSGAVHLYTWGPIPTAGPPMEGLAYRQTLLSDGGRGESIGNSVVLYSPFGATFNDLAVGAPGRNSGKGGVTLYRPTTATNLAFRATVAASGTDSAYGSALAAGSVRMAPPPPPGLPEMPDATLLVGAPLALTSAIPAGRVAGIGFPGDNAALPTQMISFSQTMKTPYTR